MIVLGAVVPEIPISTFAPEAVVRGDSFEQCGLSCPVFPGKEAD